MPQTVIAQIAGEVLGIPLDKIRIVDNDTETIPYDLGSWGSRTTYVNGIAVKEAAEEAKKELLEIAAIKFDLPIERLMLRDGMIGPKDEWTKALPVSKITLYGSNYLGRTISGRGRFYDPEAPIYARGEGSHSIPILVYGCQIAEVEIDMETGHVKVVKITAVHDVGKAINPNGVRGQVQGGIVQGIGFALTEGIIEEEGKVKNPNFLDYKILSAADIPEIDIHIVEDSDNSGPFGAKGVREQGINPTAGAIANAISNATGVRITELPLNPEKILSQIENL